MGDTLSQNDIDALLQGIATPESPAPAAAPPPAAAPAPALPAAPVQARGPAANIQRACTIAAETAAADLSRKVAFSNIQVEILPGSAAAGRIKLPAVVFHGDSQSGGFVLAMPKDMAGKVSDIKMGGDGSKPPETFSDLYLSAVSEFSNLISGSVFSALGTAGILSNTGVTLAQTPEDLKVLPASRLSSCSVISVTATIENLMEGEWIMVIGEQAAAPMPMEGPAASPAVAHEGARPVQKVEFGAFAPSPVPELPANMNLLLDVPMNVNVELGRTKMTVHDVLNLGSGSIVELDKLAGEPVDFMVNGKLIAKGEVVVIDENFGIRITDIVSPIERFRGAI